MQWYRNLPIARKFVYAFGAVCGLCILLGCYTFISFHQITSETADVSQNSFPAVVHLGEARAAMLLPPKADEAKKRRRRRRKPAVSSGPAE